MQCYYIRDWVDEFDDFDRFLAGIDLFRASKAPKLVFTGGWDAQSPDLPLIGDILIERAQQFGIERSALQTTGPVSNTEEEAAAVGKLLGATPDSSAIAAITPATCPRILLVTSAYHMTRAETLFRRAGFEVLPFAVDFQTVPSITLRSFIPRAGALKQTEVALHEMLGRLYYWTWQ